MSLVAAFGPGVLQITRTDVTTPTPVNVGFCQELTLDESAEIKELYGQNKYALVAASGPIKLTGKIKSAMISGLALNAAMYGGTFVSGQLKMAVGEAITVASGWGNVTNAATFDTDLGVVYANNQIPLTKVTGAPGSAGNYNVSAGNYGYHSGDNGNLVQTTYAYTVAGSGQTQTLANSQIGTNPTFQIDYWTTVNVAGTAKPYYVRVYECVANKLAYAHKLNDFMMPEIDFVAYQNAAGNIWKKSFPEVS